MATKLSDVRGPGLPEVGLASASPGAGTRSPAPAPPLDPAGPKGRVSVAPLPAPLVLIPSVDEPAGFTSTPELNAIIQLVALDLFMEALPHHHWVVARDGGPWCPDCGTAWNTDPQLPCDDLGRWLCVRCRQRPVAVLEFCGSCATEEQGEGRL